MQCVIIRASFPFAKGNEPEIPGAERPIGVVVGQGVLQAEGGRNRIGVVISKDVKSPVADVGNL